MLIASIVLAIVPLLGIAYIVAQGSFDTVDNLFYVLILLAMSGIFAANAAMELKRRKRVRAGEPARAGAPQFAASSSGAFTERGVVESVLFFESPVGSPDKSVVAFRPKRGPSRLLTFDGDLRNQLPAGHEVELTYQSNGGSNKVLALSYK